MQETNRSNPTPSWPGIGQVARPCSRQVVCQSICGTTSRDQGPLPPWKPPGSSCCLTITRRWVLAGNTFWHARWDIFCNIHVNTDIRDGRGTDHIQGSPCGAQEE